MPKCLHVVHVAVEIDTDRLSVLDGTIRFMEDAAKKALKSEAKVLTLFGNAKVEVID